MSSTTKKRCVWDSCEISCRQLNAKFLVVDNKAVSRCGKRKLLSCRQLIVEIVVDNYSIDRFTRVWEWQLVDNLRGQALRFEHA